MKLVRMPLLAFALLLSTGVPIARAEEGNAAEGAEPKATESVAVEVVDIAGGRAYLTPGESAGVRPGSTVTIGEERYVVIAASGAHAVVEDDGRLRVGQTGQASALAERTESAHRLPPPTDLALFRGQWPKPVPPAATRHPKHVPLGPPPGGRSFAQFGLGGGAVVPLSGGAEPIEHGELRARVHVEPLRELPLRLDADAAAQLWLADDLDTRAGDDARFPARVRQLEAAYGETAATFAALGRLRYASRTLGMLDGARAQAELANGLTLGAFGGLVPDPLDGVPSTEATRFGAEVGYEVLDSNVRPRLSLSGHGSRFDGAFDERRLTATVDLFPEDAHLGAYGELSLHDGDNPWGASAQALSAAGIDGGVRFGVLELGARADLQRPERSMWLAAHLPPGYLCTSEDPVADVPCFGDEARYLGSFDAGVRLERVSFGGSIDASASERGGAEQVGGALRSTVLDVVGPLRLDTALLASEGSLVHMIGARLGIGAELVRGGLDVSLHYQPSLLRYDAEPDNFVEHDVGTRVWLTPTEELTLSLDADAIVGRDVDAILVQALMTYLLR